MKKLTVKTGQTFIDPNTGIPYPDTAFGFVTKVDLNISYDASDNKMVSGLVIMSAYVSQDKYDEGIVAHHFRLKMDKVSNLDTYFSDANFTQANLEQFVLDYPMIPAVMDLSDPQNPVETTPAVLLGDVVEWSA